MVCGDETLLSARTSDFFHADGKMDSRIEVLNMFCRWTPITGKAAVTTLLETLSSPLASVEKCATAFETSGKVSLWKGEQWELFDFIFQFIKVAIDGFSKSIKGYSIKVLI